MATPIQSALIVLSMITGEEWDEDKLTRSADTLQEVALNTLVKQGVSRSDAASIVAERFARFVAPVLPTGPQVLGGTPSKPTMPSSESIAARVAARMRERKLPGSGDSSSSIDL